jgi:hypothetical protein
VHLEAKFGKESLLKVEQSSNINCVAAAVFLQHRESDVHQPLEFLSSASHPWSEGDEGLITLMFGDMLELAAMWTIVGSTRTTRLPHAHGHFKMDGLHGRHLCVVLVKALIALLRSAPSKLLDPPARPAKS